MQHVCPKREATPLSPAAIQMPPSSPAWLGGMWLASRLKVNLQGEKRDQSRIASLNTQECLLRAD